MSGRLLLLLRRQAALVRIHGCGAPSTAARPLPHLLLLPSASPPSPSLLAPGWGAGVGVGEQRRPFGNGSKRSSSSAARGEGEGKAGAAAEDPKATTAAGAAADTANGDKETEADDAADAAEDADDAAEDEESEHSLHELAAGGGAMRANLEAWLVAACLDGTGAAGAGSAAAGPSSPPAASAASCTFLTLAPRPQLAPAAWAQAALASLTAPMRRALQRRGEALVRGAIERDFSADEFCDGCGGAFRSVMRAYGQGRWDLLAGMASPAVVASMRAAWSDLGARRGLEPISVAAEVRRVSLAAPNVWRRAAVARLDPARAGAALPAGCVPWWGAVAVEVEARVDVSLGPRGWREGARARRRREAEGEEDGGTTGGGQRQQRGKDGDENEDEHEDENHEDEEEEDDDEEEAPAPVERSSTRRVGYLVFARGPLPRSAAPALYSPWWLVGWY